MTTMTPTPRVRKQLSDQLDRLDEQLARQDAVIDALAEGLNQAVADAAKEGVKEAVQAAVVELLTNIELRAALHRATAPPAGDKPSAWDRVKDKVRRAAAGVKAMVGPVRDVVAAKVEAVKVAAAGAVAPAWVVWRLRKAALVGLGVGVLVAGVAYAGSHGFAALLSGLGAAVTTLGVRAALLVRKAVRRLALT